MHCAACNREHAHGELAHRDPNAASEAADIAVLTRAEDAIAWRQVARMRSAQAAPIRRIELAEHAAELTAIGRRPRHRSTMSAAVEAATRGCSVEFVLRERRLDAGVLGGGTWGGVDD